MLGWTITRGTLGPCEFCARGKAKQKNTNKNRDETVEKVTVPGELVHLDLSKVTVHEDDGSEFDLNHKYWKILVDAATGKKWSHFTTTKSGMVEPTCEWLNKCKTRGLNVKAIRLDPAGENKKLEKRAQSVEWQSLQPLDFQFTSRDTPQHNSDAETSFPYLAGCSRAMMGAAYIPGGVRGKVVIEALQCATMLDGLVAVTVNGVTATRDEHVFKSNPKWANHLRTWGEAGVVKEGKRSKTGDRGKTMMFVGYAADRESDSFRMWDSDTNRVVVTRDVIFLKRMFFERPVHESTYLMDEMSEETRTNVRKEASEGIDGDSDDEDGTPPDDRDSDEDESEAGRVDDDDAIATRQSRVGRVCRTPEWLKDYETKLVNSEPGTFAEMRYLCLLAECHNDELFTVMKAYNDMETMLIGAGVGGGFSNTNELKVMNYKQAMASDDADEWNDEIGNEHKRFKKFNAVTVVKRKDLPKGAKVCTTTWAMKKKANGTYRGRLNVRGFEQVEGMHFFGDSIAAPVTNPNTIRFCLVLLACMPLWISRVLDVEGAFLQGQFVNGEVIYIGVPDGMEKYYGSRDDVVLLLNVPLYGTKQAANCFYTSLRKSASKRNYKRSRADPCLYYIWTDGRLALFATWVDDIIVFGHPQDVDTIEKNLKEAFVCKSEGELKEYVGSKIDVMRKSNGLATVKITQPVLIQKLEDEFDVSTGKAPGTPARPGEVLSKLHGGELLTSAAATNYRSGTATLMFIMQWSRPDIFNATRGCARHMSAPGTVHNDALYWLIHYVISTRNRGLVLEPDRVWDGSSKFKFRIGGRADSNYAANEDDRRSVTGGRVRLEGCPVTFRSATQRFVTLSVTEAEGAAGNMVAQDMMYLYRSLTEIGLSVELPMVLEMDNSGAVDLANSYSVGGRTRHVDVRLYYLRELKEEGLLVIKHIPGENNDADIFTKNTDARTFERHIPSFVGKDEYMVKGEEDVKKPRRVRFANGS
eukprot:g29.t1 g29   contig1:64548-67487(+)